MNKKIIFATCLFVTIIALIIIKNTNDKIRYISNVAKETNDTINLLKRVSNKKSSPYVIRDFMPMDLISEFENVFSTSGEKYTPMIYKSGEIMPHGSSNNMYTPYEFFHLTPAEIGCKSDEISQIKFFIKSGNEFSKFSQSPALIQNIKGFFPKIDMGMYYRPDGCTIRFSNCGEWSFPKHFDCVDQISCCVKGSRTFMIWGNKFVLEKGDALFIPEGLIHSVVKNDGGDGDDKGSILFSFIMVNGGEFDKELYDKLETEFSKRWPAQVTYLGETLKVQ